MATSAFGGFTGHVYISTDGRNTWWHIGETTSATINPTGDSLDATSTDSQGWREKISGLNSWDMSIDALYVYGNQGQTELEETYMGRQTASFRFLPKLGIGNKGYQGDAIVTNLNINYSIDAVVALTVSLDGSAYLEPYIAGL